MLKNGKYVLKSVLSEFEKKSLWIEKYINLKNVHGAFRKFNHLLKMFVMFSKSVCQEKQEVQKT